jgi:hypothetical protein
MPAEPGAVPAEEFAVLDSQVHHLTTGFSEARIEWRTRFDLLDGRLHRLDQQLSELATAQRFMHAEYSGAKKFLAAVAVAVIGAAAATWLH